MAFLPVVTNFFYNALIPYTNLMVAVMSINRCLSIVAWQTVSLFPLETGR